MNSEIFAISPTDIRHQASSATLGTSIGIGVDCLNSIESTSIGHAAEGDTGVTVIAVLGGVIGTVDIRGGGPGTRETDLLAPENMVECVHAVVLVGGSMYGFTAVDGIMRELRDRGIGFEVTSIHPDIPVPIVPGVVIFDLLLGEPTLPIVELGREALSHALGDVSEGTPSGTVDAGVDAMAGAIKGGFGQVRVTSVDGEYFVVAAIVVNPLGAIIDPEGRLYGTPAAAGASKEILAQLNQVFVGRTKTLANAASDGESSASMRDTAIDTVMTNASVTTVQLKRLAVRGYDGLIRAIRPAHAPMDGDTLSALNSAEAADGENAELVSLGLVALLVAMAVDAVQMAIVDAAMSVTGRAEVAALSEMLDKQ